MYEEYESNSINLKDYYKIQRKIPGSSAWTYWRGLTRKLWAELQSQGRFID